MCPCPQTSVHAAFPPFGNGVLLFEQIAMDLAFWTKVYDRRVVDAIQALHEQPELARMALPSNGGMRDVLSEASWFQPWFQQTHAQERRFSQQAGGRPCADENKHTYPVQPNWQCDAL